MRARRGLLLLLLMFLFVIPSAFAGILENGLRSLMGPIADIIMFDWVNGNEEAFVRFFYWILVFALIYFSALLAFSRLSNPDIGKKIAMVLGLVFSITATILTPPLVIVTIFTGYAGLIAFLLVIAAIALVFYIAYGPWMANMGGATRAVIRIGLFLVLIYMIEIFSTQVPAWVGSLV